MSIVLENGVITWSVASNLCLLDQLAAVASPGSLTMPQSQQQHPSRLTYSAGSHHDAGRAWLGLPSPPSALKTSHRLSARVYTLVTHLTVRGTVIQAEWDG